MKKGEAKHSLEEHQWQIASINFSFDPPLAIFVCRCGALKEIKTRIVLSNRKNYK